MTKVKVCGNTQPEDIKLAVELGVDYLGFIFTESKRKVTLEQAKAMMQAAPNFKNYVGVFSNQPKQEVEFVARKLGLKFLQFHGEETARYCHYFMNHGFEVIKTFRIKDARSLKRIDEYNVSYFLFDTYDEVQKGGTGRPFDWNLIEDRPYVHEKLFLSGGLNPENIKNAIKKIHPAVLDVSSGVELSPGKKDPLKMKEFIRVAKESSLAHERT